MKLSPGVVAALGLAVGLAVGFWWGTASAHQQAQQTFATFMDDRVHADIETMCGAVYQATLDEEEADVRLRFAISGNRPRALPLLQQEFALCRFDQVIRSSGAGQTYLVLIVKYPTTLDALK